MVHFKIPFWKVGKTMQKKKKKYAEKGKSGKMAVLSNSCKGFYNPAKSPLL
jgi:hypothetical protein